MIRVSPLVAMLWENWRLSRVEIAQRLGLGLVGASAALTLFNAGANAAFLILIVLHCMFLFSISKLNGGRFMDGYKPGFPLYLLYARPVTTASFVGVAMIYDAIACTALYLVSAGLLKFTLGVPLPLFSVALWLVAFHLVCTCIQWATRNRVVQWTGSIVLGWPFFFWLYRRVASPLQVEFSLAENALMVLIALVSIGLTVVGVARQRRGDAVATVPQQKVGSGGYPDWLINLYRFPCSTSSATRAQVWFELKSSGLPVLAIGLGVALLTCLLFVISISVAPARYAAVSVAFLSVPILLFTLGGNAFSVRRKQGRTYASAFEMTQPQGTAQLAALKLLVRTACVLVALIAIVASLWASSALLDAWGQFLPDGKQDALPGLLEARRKLAGILGSLTGHAPAALAVIASIAVASIVAWQATREAIRARHPRLLLVVQWLPAVWGLAIILLTLAIRKGFGPVPLVGEIVKATFWIAGAAMLLTTTYLLWSGFAQRALTIRYACGALVLATAFGAAWSLGMPVGSVVGILWLALLILMAIVLAPWSLNQIRHA